MIVVDASLAAKWVLSESGSSDALDFLARYYRNLVGPDLIFTEVASAIVRRANEDKSLCDEAMIALQKWTAAWPLHVVKPYRVTQTRLFQAGRLAIDMGHPVKDCIYFALAIELECELATCDAKFARKANTVSDRVRLLEDYLLSTAV